MSLSFPFIRSAAVIAIATLAGAHAAVARAQTASRDTPYAQTRAALARADVPGAEAAARAVLASDTVIEHRRNALSALANLAWRVHLDTVAADAFVRQSLALTGARAAALTERARAESAFGNYGAAAADAREALATATSTADRIRALALEARAVIAPALIGNADREQLVTVLGQLVLAARETPGEISSARELVTAAAIAQDGPALLAGWRSYYLALTNGGGTNVLAAPRDALERALPHWNRSTDSRPLRRTIVVALADSRFFEPAAYLARQPFPDGSTLAATDARAREIVAYEGFLNAARHATDEFYRLTALHTANESAWRENLTDAARAAWPQLVWGGEPPRFTFNRFEAEAGRRFGLVLRFGSTGNFHDAHIGHVVADERHSVTQWGHTSVFHFVQLDQMVSNGFLSWFWDGQGADGGWNNSDMVVQVRPSYASHSILAWISLTDSAQRATIDSSVAADSAADLVRARTTPIAFFPSVAHRLERAGERALLDSLRRAGLSGDSLRERFVRQLSDETQEYSIFQHEGRHAIDQGISNGHCGLICLVKGMLTPSAKLEFTAKLAQVEFGPRPELGLGGIITPSIGDQTPHGMADAQVLRGVLDWMSAHESEIAHLDRAEPLLPQLPQLTGEQLRAAFRSLDPLAPAKDP